MKLTENPTLQSRFKIDDVARARLPGGLPVTTHEHMIILTDDPALAELSTTYCCTNTDKIEAYLDSMKDKIPPEGALLCFNSDALAAKVVLLLEKKGIRFLPFGGPRPVAAYWRTDDAARDTLHELWEQERMNFGTIFELEDYQYLMQIIKETRHLQGSYVEIGVSWGSSARIALHYMRKTAIERSCYFIDTFDGFSYDEVHQSVDRYWTGDDQIWGTEAKARELLPPYDSSENGVSVTIVKANIMVDSLPEDITSIAVANIDVDMIGAVRSAMQKVHPLLVTGGVMILEDTGHTPLLYGACAAVHEFIEAFGHLYVKLYVSSGQMLLIKR